MMLNSKKLIEAYYHPTTVVFLDDNQAFLDSIPLALEANVAYESFIDAKDAIHYINNHTQYNTFVEKDTNWVDSNALYHFKIDLESIQYKTGSNERFSEPSILVIDYSMPGQNQNGLDVCKAIDNPYVKKILLTGVADEKIAIEALNNKVIDYYLKKSTPEVFTQINQLIHHYQHAFFRDMTRVTRENIKVSNPMIDDPALVEHFFNIIKKEKIVEYHLNIESNAASLDFLMLDEQGNKHRFLVFKKDDIRAHIELAEESNAPAALINALQHQDRIPLFPSKDGFYHSDLEAHCLNYLHLSHKVNGEEPYRLSFIREENMTSHQPKPTFSFLQYLQEKADAYAHPKS